MRIAILGATSQIAKDLVLSFSATSAHELVLFARRPEVVSSWLVSVGLSGRYPVADFGAIEADEHFDALCNFVGVGNPAQATTMGASIFDVTLKYDEMALDYVRQRPNCRYIFLSSGAAYGASFDEPVDANTKAVIAINNLLPQDWYAAAKLHAECRHRSLPHLPIVDIRIFNYFSNSMDISSRFLITDILRAIKLREKLFTSSTNIVRDYIGPDDFFQLVMCILNANPMNDVVDCYTREPLSKMLLLSKMKEWFGLVYILSDTVIQLNSTGLKTHYFSKNRRAAVFGYKPKFDSLETIKKECYGRSC